MQFALRYEQINAIADCRSALNSIQTMPLRGPDGERLAGFDNAHPVARQKRGEPQDHRHRLRSIRPYEYRDAVTLLGDFWRIVDAVLRERGVIP